MIEHILMDLSRDVLLIDVLMCGVSQKSVLHNRSAVHRYLLAIVLLGSSLL